MTYKEFMELVAEMRKAQKQYNIMRTSDNLTRKKRLEKEVDMAITAAMPNDNNKQTNLF